MQWVVRPRFDDRSTDNSGINLETDDRFAFRPGM